MASPLVAEVLGAMITPAVLISAGGTLVLAADAEKLGNERSGRSSPDTRKRQLIVSQLHDLSRRALLLRSAIAALYVAIGFLIATSIGIGIFTAFGFDYSWLPITLGMLGTGGLLWATGLLVREARLAIASTLEEMRYATAMLRGEAPES